MRTQSSITAGLLFTLLSTMGACSLSDEGSSPEQGAALGEGGSGVLVGLGGKCLDSGGAANGAKVVLWECNGGATQRWTLADGQIIGAGGKCLDVDRALSTNGTSILLWECHGRSNQRWTLEGKRIVGLGGKCLDVARAETANGTPILLWECHGRENQEWTLQASGATPDAGAVLEAGAPSPGTPSPTPGPAPGMPAKRDARKWPFASTSIWNMPIGSNAVFAPANLTDVPEGDVWAPMPQVDEEHIVLRPDAPLVNINYSDAGWTGKNRCAATGGLLVQVPIPASYVVPHQNTNAGAAFLMPDGRSIVQVQPLARCTAGGAGTSIVKFEPVDIQGDGRRGAHGGSALSSIGGSLRVGELRPSTGAPRHALKINVDARAELLRCPTFSNCYRWPAYTADSYATSRYGTNNPNQSSAMKMGALLAIPSNVSIASLGLETEPGKMLAWTLQNYGAYIVDDTWGPAFALSAEVGPDGKFADQFRSDWGFPLEQRVRDATPWVRDVQRLRRALRVVDNNGPNSVGGGGTPLQPLAPGF